MSLTAVADADGIRRAWRLHAGLQQLLSMRLGACRPGASGDNPRVAPRLLIVLYLAVDRRDVNAFSHRDDASLTNPRRSCHGIERGKCRAHNFAGGMRIITLPTTVEANATACRLTFRE